MASIRMEFHEHEKEKMWKIYNLMQQELNPTAPKPPKKNKQGKWHCYMEDPEHKKCAKDLRKQRQNRI